MDIQIPNIITQKGATVKDLLLGRTNSGWNATFLVDGQPDAEVVGLFKTHTIPTAFTKHADAVEVLSQLSRLNPGHRVRLEDPTQWQGQHTIN